MRKAEIGGIACSLAAVVILSGGCLFARAGEAPDSPSAKPDAVCKEAIVNPVSGHAECVNPRGAPVDPPPPRPTVVKLAIFDFELEDATPAAALMGQASSTRATMGQVSEAARDMFLKSGRYVVTDVTGIEAEPVRTGSLRNCDGCEAGIALQSGADQALIGVVRRITQTDYYVMIRITDAQTEKVLDEQAANFAGGPEGWASGVRMLIKHQILLPSDET